MSDPRKTDSAKNVNELLLDSAVRHRIGLERVSGSIRNSIIELLNESDQDIEERLNFRLQRGLSEGAARPQQLQALRNEIQQINRDVMDDANKKLKQRLQKLTVAEADMQRENLERAIPVQMKPSVPDTNTLETLVVTNPFEGNTLSQWSEKVSRDRTSKILNEVRKGIVEGDSNQEIVSRVVGSRQFDYKDGVLNKSRNNVAAITRTAVTEFSSTAREMTYQQNQSVIKAVQWVSTLDSRTTMICSVRDGMTFNVGQGPRPPAHFACRSATAPVTKSWREMGIDRDEISPSTRASMNGQVPSTTNFEGWLHQQPNSVRKKVLGSTRTELFNKGNLDLNDFVRNELKKSHELISIDQLRRQHSETFEELGL
jgi:SPP1 gp7 family putative phage head morphogenesis protein